MHSFNGTRSFSRRLPRSRSDLDFNYAIDVAKPRKVSTKTPVVFAAVIVTVMLLSTGLMISFVPDHQENSSSAEMIKSVLRERRNEEVEEVAKQDNNTIGDPMFRLSTVGDASIGIDTDSLFSDAAAKDQLKDNRFGGFDFMNRQIKFDSPWQNIPVTTSGMSYSHELFDLIHSQTKFEESMNVKVNAEAKYLGTVGTFKTLHTILSSLSVSSKHSSLTMEKKMYMKDVRISRGDQSKYLSAEAKQLWETDQLSFYDRYGQYALIQKVYGCRLHVDASYEFHSSSRAKQFNSQTEVYANTGKISASVGLKIEQAAASVDEHSQFRRESEGNLDSAVTDNSLLGYTTFVNEHFGEECGKLDESGRLTVEKVVIAPWSELLGSAPGAMGTLTQEAIEYLARGALLNSFLRGQLETILNDWHSEFADGKTPSTWRVSNFKVCSKDYTGPTREGYEKMQQMLDYINNLEWISKEQLMSSPPDVLEANAREYYLELRKDFKEMVPLWMLSQRYYALEFWTPPGMVKQNMPQTFILDSLQPTHPKAVCAISQYPNKNPPGGLVQTWDDEKDGCYQKDRPYKDTTVYSFYTGTRVSSESVQGIVMYTKRYNGYLDREKYGEVEMFHEPQLHKRKDNNDFYVSLNYGRLHLTGGYGCDVEPFV
eukprot:Nk52_evm3s317 gene=Nk52_evmTU3s317